MTLTDQEQVYAELLAINQALTQALFALSQTTPQPRRFLSEQMEIGLRNIPKAPIWGIDDERKSAIFEEAQARFARILGSVPSE